MNIKIGSSPAHFVFNRRAININASNASPEPQPEPQPQIDTFFITYVRKVIEAYELEDTDVTHYDYFAYERDGDQGFAVVTFLKEGSNPNYPQATTTLYYPATSKDCFYCVDYTGNASGVNYWTKAFETSSGNITAGIVGITNVIYTTRNLFYVNDTPTYAAGVVTDAMQERFGRVVEKLKADQPAVLAKLLPYLQKVINHYSSEIDTTKPMSEYQFFALERNNSLGIAIGVIPKAINPNNAFPQYYGGYYQTAGSKNYFLYYGYNGAETYFTTTTSKSVDGLNNLFFSTIIVKNGSANTYKYPGYVNEEIIARIQENGLLT